MTEVLELALHARARRLLFLLLRRHGLDFFLDQRPDEHFPRIDPRKVDLVIHLCRRARPGAAAAGDDEVQEASARAMVRRILIRRLATRLVEAQG
jgi:hypothetical protein